MTPLALALVLASALVHATWNLWAKQVGPRAESGALLWMLTTISAVAYAGPALWLAAHTGWRPGLATLGWIAGSGLIHVGYFLLLLRGYRAADLSVVYPLARGTGPMLAAFAAFALFREPATPAAVAGVLLIAGGVLTLVGRRPTGVRAGLAPGIAYGLATGAFIAAYTLWDGWSVKRAAIPPLVFYWGGEVVRVVLFTPAALARRAEVARLWREDRARVLGIALLSPLSYILILVAMRAGAVSRIAPAREIGILFGAWLGGRVLGEGERARRIAAAALFAGGVIALAFAKN